MAAFSDRLSKCAGTVPRRERGAACSTTVRATEASARPSGSLGAQVGQRGKGLRTGPSWLAGPGVWTAGLELAGPERKSPSLGTYLQLDLLGVLQTRVAVGGSLRGTGDLEFRWGVGLDVARVIFIIRGLSGLCIGC